MPNTILLRSDATLTNRRLRLAGKDAILTGGSVGLLDLGAALYPAQNASFTGIEEGVSGRSVVYSAGGGGSGVTFSGGMAGWPADQLGNSGMFLGAWNDTGIDLAVRGTTLLLASLWLKFTTAMNSFERQLLFLGQNGIGTGGGSGQSQFGVIVSDAGSGTEFRINVAGQRAVMRPSIAVGTVYNLACVARLDPSAGFTTLSSYLATNAQAPALIGVQRLTYTAFASLSSGGLGVGRHSNVAAASTISAQGVSIGRAWIEDLSQSQRDPERRIFRDWQANAGRFS